jgi:Flp pilus assembly protein TadG
MRRGTSYVRDEQGAAAVEFAMVVPVTVLLLLTIFHLSFAVYATSSLHWAVEQTARCAAVGQLNSGLSCGTTKSSAQTYAASIYHGPLVSPTFVAAEVTDSTSGYCRQVSGSGTYRIRLGVVNIDVPVSAQACFPEQNTGTGWS